MATVVDLGGSAAAPGQSSVENETGDVIHSAVYAARSVTTPPPSASVCAHHAHRGCVLHLWRPPCISVRPCAWECLKRWRIRACLHLGGCLLARSVWQAADAAVQW